MIREDPLSEMFHVRCVFHLIKLIIQDGLELISISLEAIWFSIQFIYQPNKL